VFTGIAAFAYGYGPHHRRPAVASLIRPCR
jgi:hypothetical protein